MNTLQLVWGGLLAAAISSCATHGPDDKLKRDATYSTHNYKHPNKAAQARQWEQSPGVTVQPRNNREVALDNYKGQRPGSTPQGGISVPHQPSATMADRHYKTQNWLKNQPEPVIAKTPESVPGRPGVGH